MDSQEDDRFEMNGDDRRGSEDEDEEQINKSQRSSNQSDSSGRETNGSPELNDKQQLQYQILQVAIKEEKSTPYQQHITSQIIAKLNDLSAASSQKSGEDLVNIKIQELALNKLLTLNYGKSDFRLVVAHYHLGEAYLSYDCLEQAIEHISLALHKNEKLIDDLPRTVVLQISMQITLAEAFMAQGNYDDALDTLGRAQQLEGQYNAGEEGQNVRNVKTLVLKAQCLCKQRQFSAALEVIEEVVIHAKSKQLGKVEYAFALVDKANILAEMQTQERFQKAVEYQEEAINLLVSENYPKPEQVAQLYATLSGYYEKLNNADSALTCIQKVKTLYEELYSPDDKRVIKARRKIATALLKSQRYKEAVTELLEIAKLQQKVFGETAQLARTLKLLGTVYSSLGIGDSKVYLKRALTIFQATGNKKQAQDIREKLKNLLTEHATGELDANIISQQEI